MQKINIIFLIKKRDKINFVHMVIIFEDYYLFFKMLVGDFMIDDTNYADCLVCEEAFDTKKNKMKNFYFL